MMKRTTYLVSLAVLLATPSSLLAQVLYGSTIVDARDQTGGAVPAAEVTITNTDTGWTRSGTSSDVGAATFTGVPPGSYDVRVNISGFKEFRTTGVRVSEDNVLRVNSLLEVGQVTDTVTVSAGIAVLQTDRADVRTEIPTAQLENLPVPVGRNYQNLFVTPGAKNWCIGCTGRFTPILWHKGAIPIPESPSETHESPGVPVTPASLYLAQLRDRLGPQALKNIGR